MTIRYQRDGSLLMYECHQIHSQLAGKTCQTMRGDRIDQAVVQSFLQALQPAHLEVALSALDQLEARGRQVDQQWQRQIERAEVMRPTWPGGATGRWTQTIVWWPVVWNGSGTRNWQR
jgi:hypothetical protein